jgi:L-amino acid N-acyltransferase YncA
MLKKYTLKEAKIEDVNKIIQIYNESIQLKNVTGDLDIIHSKQNEKWYEERTKIFPIYKVIDEANNILGWISIQHFFPKKAFKKAVEISIYIKQEKQNQGVGSFALKKILYEIKKKEYQTCVSLIFDKNYQSEKLFQKFGFKLWGFLPKIACIESRNMNLKIFGIHIE